MNRRIIGIFITSVLSALPALGATNRSAVINKKQEIIDKYCVEFANSSGGNINCNTKTLSCGYSIKPEYTGQEIKKAVIEYCNLISGNDPESNFDFADDTVVPTVTEAEEVAAVESTVTDTCGPTDKCPDSGLKDYEERHKDKISGAIRIDNIVHVTGCVEPYKPQNRATCIRNGETVVYYTGCELKVGDNCTLENAKTAKYVKVGNDVVCHAKSCKCGYKLSNHKCIELEKDEKKCTALNASAAYYECQGDKKVCKIETCKDTHFLDSTQNKCVSKKSVKCQDNQTVDATGKCVDQTTIQPTDTNTCGEIDACDKLSQSDFRKKHSGLNSTNCINGELKITGCKDGYNPTGAHTCTRNGDTIYYYDNCEQAGYNTCGIIDSESQCTDKDGYLNQNPNVADAKCINGNWKPTQCKKNKTPGTAYTCTRSGKEITYYSSCETTSDTTDDPARDYAEKTCNKIKRGIFLGTTYGATAAECINNQWQITECENGLFGQNEQTATLHGQSITYYASCEKCRVTNKWKKDNHAQDAECDPETGEIYITECDTGYLLTEQILDSNHNTLGYKKCEPNFETSKNLCEQNGNGKWQEKQNKCDCKNNYFWDENDGCVASTENLKQATKKLEQLKSLLDEKLKTLNSAK